MPSRMAWVQRPSGLMKVREVQVLFVEATLVRIENVSWVQISIINLYCYWMEACFAKLIKIKFYFIKLTRNFC